MRIELGDMPIPHAREKPRYGATRAVKEAMQSGNGMDGCVPIMFAALFVRALGLFVASFVFGVLVIVALAVWAYKPGIAGAAALPAMPRIARAQAYPSRPVHVIVGFPPGGTADIVARLMGQRLSERLGQQVIIENRPGAGANIGTEAVVRAPADGYTLLLVGSYNAINATLYDRLNFNFSRDIVPVAGLIRAPSVLEVNPSVPAKSVPEFIAYAKANPGKLTMASSGIGTPSHVRDLTRLNEGIPDVGDEIAAAHREAER
jgi:hypothetical protein